MTSILKVDTIKKTDNSTFPIGKVLQCVQGTTATMVNFTSTSSYVDTGLSASITPSSTSSKVLIQVSQMFRVKKGMVEI